MVQGRWWTVPITFVEFGNSELDINGFEAALIDSGSTTLYMPQKHFIVVIREIAKHCLDQPEYKDGLPSCLCFQPNLSFPHLIIDVMGQPFDIGPQTYLIRRGMGCKFNILPNQ